ICAASCAASMVGEATRPKVSLSAQVHSATLPATFPCALTQAAGPPMLPASVLLAPLNSLVKLVMKPAGETPDRWPPMKRITCGLVPPAPSELASYTASTTSLAWPALLATTCCCKSFAFICCSSWGLRTYAPRLAGVTSACAGPRPPSSNAPTVTTTTPPATPPPPPPPPAARPPPRRHRRPRHALRAARGGGPPATAELTRAGHHRPRGRPRRAGPATGFLGAARRESTRPAGPTRRSRTGL